MFRPLLAVALLVLATPAAALDCPPNELFGAPVSVTTGPNPVFMTSLDFDKDGDLDLAVTNCHFAGGGSQATLAILRNNGFGAFTVIGTYPVPSNSHGVVAGDFNEDGILDLAVGCKNSSQFSILLGQGAGSLGNGMYASAVTYPAGGAPFQLVTADFNGDGHLDLAAALNNTARVAVCRGAGNGTFGAPLLATIGDVSTGLVTGDFTGDGILDLVATENYQGKIALLRGLGTNATSNAGFAAAVKFTAGIEPFDLEVLDYDKDGILDLAVGNGTVGGTIILHGGGAGGVANGTFATAGTLVTGNTAGIAVLDANADGLLDIVTAENATPIGRRLHLLLGQGTGGVGNGSFVAAGTIPLPEQPYQVIARDFDGDTILDLAVTDFLSTKIELLRGGCAGEFPDPRAPVLTRVRDVPADEGGRLYLTFLRSSLDILGGVVTSYRVWQRLPGELALPAGESSAVAGELRASRESDGRFERVEAGPDGRLFLTYWEHVATLAAQRLEGYAYTATTSEDSTAERPVSTAFFITAATANPDIFYSSDIDSAGSVDNLAPSAPSGLGLHASGPAGRTLRWEANAEPDVELYRVERSPSAAFAPGEVQVLSTQPETEYVDADLSAACYRVVALDHSRNASAPSAIVNASTVGVEAVARLSLAGTFPHPAHSGSLRISLSLADAGPAQLELFDAKGRRVASRSLDGVGPGAHLVSFDSGRRLTPGLYWARLRQGDARVERRIVVID